MAKTPQILDQFGRPVRRAELKRELAAPTFGGVRSPLSGDPSSGLDPVRLGNILRAADQGDPVRYLELAEAIEEKDLHYLGVLGTRKRSVSQIPITVQAGGETALDQEAAKLVEDWLARDHLRAEVVDILDALGKGYSHTEILWDTSSGQWMPGRLERRDQRWFTFDRRDLTTPMMLDESGQRLDYPGFKFIYARMQAKSGLPVRSGLARAAVWAYLFKAYTQRDWAIFTQTYGQPIRVGKYGGGASEEDRDTLFNAVANIGGDCAAIIPDSMMIEFIESSNVGSSTDHYEKRCDWLDKQMSKAVLGQTSTTDAEVGGLGSGKEHREVQEDIERADCSDLQAILNEWLIQPWMELNFTGRLAVPPKLKIGRPEEEDLKAFTDAITPWVDRGLEVSEEDIRTKFGLSAPAKGARILGAPAQIGPQGAGDTGVEGQSSIFKHQSGVFKHPSGDPRPSAQAEQLSPSQPATAAVDAMADRLAEEASAPMGAVMAQIQAMLETAGSLEEFRERLLVAFPELDTDALVNVMADAMEAGHAAGRATLEEESG